MDNTVQYNPWSMTVKMNLEEIVKFQIIIYLYIAGIQLTPLAIDVLTVIAMQGKPQLKDIVIELADRGLFAQEQGVRNLIGKLEGQGLLIKESSKGAKNKTIYINPSLGIENKLPIEVAVHAITDIP